MADNVEMRGIEFQIINDSDEAINSIERLGKALAGLKVNVKDGISAVSRAGSAISKLRTALDGIDTSGIANKLKGLSNAINQLNINQNAKISSSLPKNITALNAAVANIQPEKIVQLGNALQAVANSSGAKISATLPKNITALNTALAELDVGGIDKLSRLGDGLKTLGELKTAKLTSFINQLGKLPAVIRELDEVDFGKFTQQMKDFAEVIKPLADEMNKVAAGFSAFPTRIQRLITSTEQYNNTIRRAARNTNAWGKALKTISLAAIFRAISKFLGSAINKASEYQEDLNLFTVSMGEYAEEAYNYAQKVSEVMGIDPSEWMRNQGVFNTIITGFGVAGDKAAFMSKNLTQLGYDIASFYNIDFESAMQKVQSGIAGELEPLRRLGYDLSVARLEQERLNLGISKSVSNMTQAEKSQLRYYTMMTQVTQVQGDMARTLEQPANMLRVLKAQLEQATRAIGNLFIPILVKVLPICIAVANALREIVTAIASLFGVTLDTPDWGDSIGSATAGTGAIADNMDSAAGSAKELKKYLAGFDELNVLPDQNQGGSGGSSGVGGGDLGIDLPGYNFLKNAVSTQIDEWKKKLEPLVNFVKDNIKEILELVVTIGAAILAWKFSTGFISGLSTLKALAQNGFSIPLTLAAGLIGTVTSFKIEFDAVEDALKNGLDGFNFAEILLSALSGTGFSAIFGKGIGQLIAKVFSGSAVANAITAGGGAISTTLIGAAIGGIVAGIPMFVTGIYDAIMNGLNWLNGLLIPAGSTLAGASVGAIIGSLGGPIGTGIGALVGLVIGALTDIVLAISEQWDEIKAFFAPAAEWFDNAVIQPVAGFFSGLWSDISTWASGAWVKIKEFFAPAAAWFTDLFNSVRQTIEDVFYNIGVIASGCWETIQIVWGIASNWLNENVVKPVATFFSGLWSDISTWASDAWNDISTWAIGAWERIKSVFSGIANWIDEKVIQPIMESVSWLWDGVKTIFSTVVGFFKGILNGVISLLNSTLNWVFSGINGILSDLSNFSIAGYSPFAGIKPISVPQIPMLANGGIVDQGQLFIAREAGAEMVGSIGRKTAVANNDQIVEGITGGVREANDDVVTAIYSVAQQIITAMREQDNSGGTFDLGRYIAQQQRNTARING